MEDKDRLTEQLERKERGEEDAYFARRDRALLETLHEANDEARRQELLERVRMRCPDCGARLVRVTHRGVTIEECPTGHGMWLTRSELHTLAQRERDSWIGRYFYRPRPVV